MQNTAKPNHTFTTKAAVVVYVGVTSSQGVRWTPSKMIHRLGKEINNPESICYWAYKVSVPHGVKKRTFEDVASPSSKCHKTQSKTKSKTKELWPLFQNNIPMFSPALTDGALGDMFYLFSADNPGLILDIIEGKKRVFSFILLKLSLSYRLVTLNLSVFDFRCYKAVQHGVGCQKHRDDPPGRGCGQASRVQCQLVGKGPTCLILSPDPVVLAQKNGNRRVFHVFLSLLPLLQN